MFEVHKLTGGDLVDRNGRAYAHESAGVIGRHKTAAACFRRLRGMRRHISLSCRLKKYEVRDETGAVVEPQLGQI